MLTRAEVISRLTKHSHRPHVDDATKAALRAALDLLHEPANEQIIAARDMFRQHQQDGHNGNLCTACYLCQHIPLLDRALTALAREAELEEFCHDAHQETEEVREACGVNLKAALESGLKVARMRALVRQLREQGSALSALEADMIEKELEGPAEASHG